MPPSISETLLPEEATYSSLVRKSATSSTKTVSRNKYEKCCHGFRCLEFNKYNENLEDKMGLCNHI